MMARRNLPRTHLHRLPCESVRFVNREPWELLSKQTRIFSTTLRPSNFKSEKEIKPFLFCFCFSFLHSFPQCQSGSDRAHGNHSRWFPRMPYRTSQAFTRSLCRNFRPSVSRWGLGLSTRARCAQRCCTHPPKGRRSFGHRYFVVTYIATLGRPYDRAQNLAFFRRKYIPATSSP